MSDPGTPGNPSAPTGPEPPDPTAYPRLAELTTIRVGGPPARLITADSEAAVIAAVQEADQAGAPLLVLAGGSNLLVADAGFPGTVVAIRTRGITVNPDTDRGRVQITVAAGEPWDEVVAAAVTEGWSGIEALSGIPGAAGATPVQNVGAYGQEVAQTITRVRVWDRHRREVRTMTPPDLQFSYRHSVLKDTIVGPRAPHGSVTPRHVVLSVTFSLQRSPQSQPVAYAALADGLGVRLGEQVPLARAREAVLAQRRQRGMVLDAADHDTWSCGSFFTNPVLSRQQYADLLTRAARHRGPDASPPPRFPAGQGTVKTSAAWLIDAAGFGKGHRMPGPAALSTKHTLALTNRGSARATDVLALAREVRDGVQDTFGVRLVNEPVLVGLTL